MKFNTLLTDWFARKNLDDMIMFVTIHIYIEWSYNNSNLEQRVQIKIIVPPI